MVNLPLQLDLECLELRNSLIFDYLWIPEEVSLDLLSRSLTLSRGASGFRILDFAPCGGRLTNTFGFGNLDKLGNIQPRIA